MGKGMPEGSRGVGDGNAVMHSTGSTDTSDGVVCLMTGGRRRGREKNRKRGRERESERERERESVGVVLEHQSSDIKVHLRKVATHVALSVSV